MSRGAEPQDKSEFFPVSVWYSGGKARAPMLSEIAADSESEWRKDLEQIRDLGFNTVRTWVEWAHAEPRRGEYDFRNLQLLCKLADEVGLKVIIQMYADSAPDWVGTAYPDARFEAQSGEKITSQAAPGFCSDHEGVRAAMLGFYMAAARAAAACPNVYAWDLWSEPHVINWAIIDFVPNAQFCFCPHTQARFREWLKHKYGTLDNVNRAWYRRFEHWDDVQPPRFGTILSYTDFIDWKTFIYEKLADDLRMRAEAIRAVEPTRSPTAPTWLVTSHAAVPSLFTTPFAGDGACDDFLMADQVDYYGTSLYPKHSFPDRHWPLWRTQVAIDFSRSANRQHGGFYVGELQAGFGTRGIVVGDPVTPEDLRLWMGSVLAGGARAINLYAYYPMSSGYESGGYGLIQLDGTSTARAAEAGRIARLVHENSQLFLASRPYKAEVAIVYNPLAQMVGGEQHSGPAGGHTDSLIGYYRAFTEENIPVDFIHRRELERGDLAQYRLIIVPYAMMFTQAAADGMKKYVEQGGHAVGEARLAWNDERGFASEVIPGMGLSDVFGVRESSVRMAEKVPITVCDDTHPAHSEFKTGDTLAGTYLAEALAPLSARETQLLARLSDESPVIVASSFGKGQTLFVGSFLGLAQQQTPSAANRRWILGLLLWAEVVPPIICTSERPENPKPSIRLHESPGGFVVFVLNYDDKPQRFRLELRLPDSHFSWRDLITHETGTVERTPATAMSLQLTVPARDVRVLSLARKNP
ncbi:MAG TPA: beta-galactosidase [Phycisphaerae bacterium]